MKIIFICLIPFLLFGQWTPANMTTIAWYSAGDLSTGDISTWTDKSGNGNNLTQATPGFRPSYLANAINGNPVISFDGGDEYMENESIAAIAQPVSVFIVVDVTNYGGGDTMFDGALVNTMRIYESGGNYSMYAGSAYATGQAIGTGFRVIEAHYEGASSFFDIDGTKVTGNPGAANGAGFTIGTHGGESSGFAQINVAEIIICNPTAAQRILINSYFDCKYFNIGCDTGQDKGFKEHSKFKRFKGLK